MITSALIVSNFFGFLLQFYLPFFLIPAEYAIYSVVLSTSQVFLIFAFEWIRLPMLRFSNVDNALIKRRRGALFFYLYFFVFILLLVVGLFFWGWQNKYGDDFSFVVFMAVLVAAFQGVFEGAQSYSRAQFSNKIFSFSWIARSALTLCFCLLFAVFFNNAVSVVFGYVFSFAFVFCFVYFRDFWKIRWRGWHEFFVFFKYGIYLTVASFLSGILAPVFKSFYLLCVGESDAGGVFWAFDLSLKVFAILGMAVNLAISQQLIKKIESGFAEESYSLAALQICGVLAMTLPVYVVGVLLKGVVIDLIVPANYIRQVSDYYFLAVTAAALLSIRMFTLDTVFIVFSKVKIAFVSPVLTFVFWGAISFLVENTAENLLGVFCLSLSFGFVVSFFLAKDYLDFAKFFRIIRFVLFLVFLFSCVLYFIVFYFHNVYLVLVSSFAALIVYFGLLFYIQTDMADYIFRGVRRG